MTGRHLRDARGDAGARVDEILDALRVAGGRVTTGRRAIVNALYDAGDHHVTAEDVARAVQAEHPDVHLSTVYRTLESLEEIGIVTRVVLGAGPVVYHLADHVHHHLRCEQCGTVIEVPGEVLDPLARRLAADYGFALTEAHLVLTGSCAACRSGGG
jgi:Fur family ferric uptake transcriptional regulator